MASWTQADIDTLRAAIASGAKRVVYRNGTTTREQEFQDTNEMRSLLAEMTRNVNGTVTYRRAKFSKGFR